MFLRSHPFLLYFPTLLQAFAWWPDLLAEHAEKFWALFTVDMDTALEAQPQDSWDSFPLFQLLNNFLRNDSEYLRSPFYMKWQGVATYYLWVCMYIVQVGSHLESTWITECLLTLPESLGPESVGNDTLHPSLNFWNRQLSQGTLRIRKTHIVWHWPST